MPPTGLANHLIFGKKLRNFPRCSIGGIRSMDRVFANRLGVGFTDGPGCGLCRIGRSHDLAIFCDRVFALEHLHHHRTGRHELNQLTEEWPLTVHCVKFGKELPGLDRVPWKGELGQRIYESVSKDAWKLWIEHSKMIMNEYRLNPLDPNSQKIMQEQLEQFFFGEGAKLPEGYVAPKAKG